MVLISALEFALLWRIIDRETIAALKFSTIPIPDFFHFVFKTVSASETMPRLGAIFPRVNKKVKHGFSRPEAILHLRALFPVQDGIFIRDIESIKCQGEAGDKQKWIRQQTTDGTRRYTE